MSDNWLRYVPADPYFRPVLSCTAAAEAMLRSFAPQAESVRSEFHGSVTFFDPGANWSGVECSACGTDAEAWWGEAMSFAAETRFTSLSTTAQCCGATVSLNELRYGWPAAFGSFVLEAMNPNIKNLSPEQIERLSAIIGCAVREIPVHL
jgi:hypothetical protein